MDTPKRAISKLKGLVIDEVSHCDSGANFFSEVLIAKSGEDEVTASFEEFQDWIAKSDLEPDSPAAEAFAQFARERTEKASPTPAQLHHDAPMGRQVKDKRKCPKCDADVPANASKCLACKAKLTKALPPKLKRKKKPKAPSDVAGLTEPTDDAEDDSESDASRFDVTSGEEATGDEEDLEAEDQEDLDYEGEEDEAPFDTEDEELEEDDEEEEAVAEGEEIDEEFDPSKVTLPGDLPKEVGEYISSLEALIEHQETQMREQEQMTLAKADDTVTKDDLAFLQDIHKSLTDGEEIDREALTKAFETMSTTARGWQEIAKAADERANEATTVAKAERAHRLTQERVALVKSWSSLPLDADAVAVALFKASEVLEEDVYKTVIESLEKANEVASMAREISEGSEHPLFSEIGKTGSGDSQEPADELGRVVKVLRDADPNLSQPQAINKALNDNPALYDQSLKS